MTINQTGPPLAQVAPGPAKVMHQASVSEIAQAIAAYVEKNPEAQDTLDGIVEWWLPQFQNTSSPAVVKEALDELVADGLITAHTAKDEQILYRATRQADDQT